MKNRTSTLASLSAAACLFCGSALAGTYANININGNFTDWSPVPVLVTSSSNSSPGLLVDYQNVKVANDNNYLYIYFSTYTTAWALSGKQSVFFDTDENPATGFNVGAGGHLGSELLIQQGGVYQEKTGVFNAGALNSANSGYWASWNGTASEYEIRISRFATNSDGSAVFPGATFNLAFLSATTNNVSAEWVPETNSVSYTFEPPPVTTLTGNLPLIPLNKTWRANPSGANLGTAWLAQSYNDTVSGWGSGAGLLGYTPNAGAYPTLNTVLGSGPTTYYFRTHFDWNYFTDNVAFVVTNYSSDGAVIYLNGTEVRRTRMPGGAIAYTNNATGSASPVGQPDVFSISSQALFVGDNILEVETHQQAGTEADMVFGLSLTAATEFGVMNVDTNMPADRTVVAGENIWVTTDVIGSGPISYQWSRNGVPLPGATNAYLHFSVILTNDAGNYVMVASNAFGLTTTRTALVTVTSTPVVFTNSALPADAYAIEGQPVTFGVAVSGSPTFQYQWFKDNSPIPNATNASYTIPFAVAASAGGYRVTVSNPSGSADSRTATLTVLQDNIPPAIAAVNATGSNQIIVSFSAPVDAFTATNAGQYALSHGLTVSSAMIAPGETTKVTLTTSDSMALGTVYQLTVNGVTDLFGNAANTTVAFARTITIDGSFDDWQGVSPLFSTEFPNNAGAADFKEIYIYSDTNRYYFRLVLWGDIPSESGHFPLYSSMFFDTDVSTNTGFYWNGLGSELNIQQGVGFQQKNGTFNEGRVANLQWTCLPATEATDYEFSISRAANFTNAYSAVFPTNINVMNIRFEGLTPSWSLQNLAMVSFTNSPTVEVASLPLGRLTIDPLAGGKVAVAWDMPATLQARGLLSSGSWTNVPGAIPPYVIPAPGTQLFFRLVK